jgi:hypothetical protein
MDTTLVEIRKEVYQKCSLEITQFNMGPESKEYHASQFKLNNSNVLCRTAKVTPKKAGQFVTIWRRNKTGIIEPFNELDSIDFYIIHIRTETKLGQFVFPKSILIQKGIMSTYEKEGKRGFRVYPRWDKAENKQAMRTQNWQLRYFYTINDATNFGRVKVYYTL